MAQSFDFAEFAQVKRGPVVESWHRGALAAVDFEGRILGTWGNPKLLSFPRSALKPFQAVALVESGAADAFGLTDAHIALACASHHAEPFQVALVEDCLARLGLSEAALVCGPALPSRTQDQAAALAAGGARRAFHNCSGKHCGFLTLARHLGGDLNYADPAHPAQQMYLAVLSEFLGQDAAGLPRGVDGCGLPALAVPLHAMAAAIARFGIGQASTASRRAAVKRVRDAMLAHPDHISGTDTATSRVIRATKGRVLLKGGAEGYLLATAVDHGLGFAIKVADGGTRAKFGVLARALGHFGVLPTAESEALIAAVEPPITNSNGQVVGHVDITIRKPGATTPTVANLEFWMGGVKEALGGR
jgi:L-asparaginase II